MCPISHAYRVVSYVAVGIKPVIVIICDFYPCNNGFVCDNTPKVSTSRVTTARPTYRRYWYPASTVIE
jgi:hypothetical protein